MTAENFNPHSNALMCSMDTINIAQAAAGTTEIVAKQAGLTPALHGMVGSLDATGTIEIQDKDGTTVVPAIAAAANAPIPIPLCPYRAMCKKAGEGLGLQVVTVGGAFVGYAVWSVDK